MYGMNVARVNTVNYDGKKYRNKYRPNQWYKVKDWKKAYITLADTA